MTNSKNNTFIGECKICKALFQKSHGNQVYCSPDCRVKGRRIIQNIYYGRSKERQPIPLKNRKCDVCGKVFDANSPSQIYCSIVCRSYQYKGVSLKNRICRSCGVMFNATGCRQLDCINCSPTLSRKVFFERYCSFGNDQQISVRLLHKALDKFRGKMRKYRTIPAKYHVSKKENYYRGVNLNDEGWKTFFPKRVRVQNIDINVEEITSGEAHRLLSCNPVIDLFNRLYNQSDIKCDPEAIRVYIRNIEQILFKKNLYRGAKIKIGLALRMLADLTYSKITEFCGASRTVIHALAEELDIQLPKRR